MHRRIKRAFCESHQKSAGVEMLKCFHSSGCECDKDPDQLPRWTPNGGANSSYDYLRWKLAEHVTNRPHCSESLVLIPHDMKFFFHAGDVCVRDIIRVEIFREIGETCPCAIDYVSIDFIEEKIDLRTE
jgi:hypothetical protein